MDLRYGSLESHRRAPSNLVECRATASGHLSSHAAGDPPSAPEITNSIEGPGLILPSARPWRAQIMKRPKGPRPGCPAAAEPDDVWPQAVAGLACCVPEKEVTLRAGRMANCRGKRIKNAEQQNRWDFIKRAPAGSARHYARSGGAVSPGSEAGRARRPSPEARPEGVVHPGNRHRA